MPITNGSFYDIPKSSKTPSSFDDYIRYDTHSSNEYVALYERLDFAHSTYESVLLVLDMKLLIFFALLAMITVPFANAGKDACKTDCKDPCAKIWCLGTNGERLVDGGSCDDQKVYGGLSCTLTTKDKKA